MLMNISCINVIFLKNWYYPIFILLLSGSFISYREILSIVGSNHVQCCNYIILRIPGYGYDTTSPPFNI